jgi:LysR family transcriptional regulator, transcription activator of glutamate synthase operon
MEIDYIREFAVIAKLGSFSIAAEELFISQSSLSKHIKALEKELGVQLFNRTSRKVSLSEAGKQILPYANQISDIKDNMLCKIAEQINSQKMSISIVSIPVMALYGITGIITNFQKYHPEISIKVSEYENYQILRLLELGECELAFTRESPDEYNVLECIPYYKDYMVAVLPVSHRFSSENTISLKQLENESFLFLDKGTVLYNLCFEACISSGFTPKLKYTGSRPENIIDLVSQGMGAALLMKRHTEYYKGSGVSYIDILPAIESTICLAKLRSRKLSDAAKLFWDYIKNRK